MKQKSSQMRFAPWPVVQAALALALSGLLLARPQAAAQGFAAGLKLCGGSLLPALFPLFVVCGLLGPLAPALGWPLRPLMRLLNSTLNYWMKRFLVALEMSISFQRN